MMSAFDENSASDVCAASRACAMRDSACFNMLRLRSESVAKAVTVFRNSSIWSPSAVILRSAAATLLSPSASMRVFSSYSFSLTSAAAVDAESTRSLYFPASARTSLIDSRADSAAACASTEARMASLSSPETNSRTNARTPKKPINNEAMARSQNRI